MMYVEDRLSKPIGLALIVEVSVNPLLVSVNGLNMLVSLGLSFMRVDSNIKISILIVIWSVSIWMLDIVDESVRGQLTTLVKSALMTGFILFIVSEIILFVTIFYSYFYNMLIPSVMIGGSYIGLGVLTYKFNGIPILNVVILFFSGIAVTASLDYIEDRGRCLKNLIGGILYSIVFVFIQYIEYKNSKFTITDSIYGNVFYTLTSLLGILMIIGVVILSVALYRILEYLPALTNLIAGSINLLFLDICFIYIYLFVYCYGS